MLELALGSPATVRVDIFDAAGRLLRVLDAGRLGAGVVDIGWDGRDAAGRHVASGTVFYRVTAGAQSVAGRWTVVR